VGLSRAITKTARFKAEVHQQEGNNKMAAYGTGDKRKKDEVFVARIVIGRCCRMHAECLGADEMC
jgi:hypothetical protein